MKRPSVYLGHNEPKRERAEIKFLSQHQTIVTSQEREGMRRSKPPIVDVKSSLQISVGWLFLISFSSLASLQMGLSLC